MKLFASFFSGILFAIGLALSGMTEPDKVIGFLDIFGTWKLELIFVMGGAVTTLFVIKTLTRNMQRPLFDIKFRTPTSQDLDLSLIVGAILFGAGWGLAGLCPGPALASIPTLEPSIFIFIGAMLAGMFLQNRWQHFQKKEN